MKFNLSKFNVKDSGKLSSSATSIVSTDSAAKANIIYLAVAEGNDTSYTEIKQPDTISQYWAAADVISESDILNFYKRVSLQPERSNAITESMAKTAEIFGIETVALPNVILKPGQELIIDTDDMTVTVDGQNAIHLLSDDSVFFMLAQGENVITYADSSGNREANIKVMWKNRWL